MGLLDRARGLAARAAAALGDARGRKRAAVVCLLVACLAALGAWVAPAAEAKELHFVNGGTATLNDDGTIGGTVTLGDPQSHKEGVVTYYDGSWATMPDGQRIWVECYERYINAPNHAEYDGPVAGTCTFTATPNGDGTYFVLVHSEGLEGMWGRDKTQRTYNAAWTPSLVASLRIHKSSTNPALTDGNAAYDLAGAKYGVYASREDAQADRNRVTTLTTGSDGNTNVATGLALGDWWVREVEAAPTYALDAEPVGATLAIGDSAATKVIEVSDKPQNDPNGMSVQKLDLDTGQASAQGAGTLAGAEFTVRYFDGYYDSVGQLPSQATRTWVLKTDSDGDTSLALAASDKATYFVSGDAFYYTSTGAVGLPLGTVTVQETKAPSGYVLNDRVSLQVLRSKGDAEWVETLNEAQVREDVVRGGVRVQKRDADLDGTTPSGDGDFAGVRLAVTSLSDGDVVVGGRTYHKGDVVATMTLSASGAANLPADALPFGTYRVTEASGNAWYRVNKDWSQDFSITTDGQVIDLTGSDKGVYDAPIRGDVEVQKRDLQNDSTTPQGGGSFEGAEITITNRSKGSVKVDGTVYRPGEVVKVITTNKDGLATTRADGATDGALPEGTYELAETKAPKGYKLNTTWKKTVRVREDGRLYSVTDPAGKTLGGATETSGVPDLVKRGDVKLNKAAFPSQGRMGHVAFLVASDTTGEAHVVVTDENGSFETTSDWNPHAAYTDDEGKAHATNANDALLSDDRKSVKDESKLDPLSGTWFYGSKADTGAAPDNKLGALPYDTYTFTELRSSANAGYQLVSFKVSVTRDAKTIDMGTVSDTVPSLDSKLTDSGGSQEVRAARSLDLEDAVDYDDVIPNARYTITMKLWDSTTQSFLKGADGRDLEVTQAFTATSKTGTVHQSVTIDASGLTGHTLVAYEYLYDANGTLVASHEDESDRDQTVSFADITTAATGLAGGKDVAADQSATMTDRVDYRGLRKGSEYVLTGTLHLRGEDGTDAGALKNAGGSDVKVSKTFTAHAADGSETLEFTFDASQLKGRSVVAFEELSRGGQTVATHADISDEGQTVRVPEIGTTAAGEGGAKAVRAASDATLTDTVAYRGLTPGCEYVVTGTLHLRGADGSDQGAVEDGAGNDVTASATFTPEASDGTVDVTFGFDASRLQGDTLVAFETVSRDGVDVATHADISDEGQAVTVPSAGTTATGEATGDHDVPGSGTVKVVDRVEYRGLVPGRAYEVAGTLYDKATGQPATQKDGSEIHASASFTPESADGSVDVTFEFDVTGLGGHDLVAFETVSSDGREWVTHADVSDEDQTVHVPEIGTTLTDGTGAHEVGASEQATVVDEVAYQNLLLGKEYVVTGTLHLVGEDGSDAGALKDGDGSDVTASATFTPDKASGTAEVTFTFDASQLKGRSVVAFEELSRGGQTVATHADISDEGQTVRVPEIGTTAAGEGGAKAVRAASDATLTDTVAYRGLTPGCEYVVTGTLHLRGADGSDQGAVEDGAGNDVTASATFTPEASDGTVDVTFGFDASRLQGDTLVAFETVSRDGVDVATHADISDEGQAVTVVSIGTQAADGADGDKEISAEDGQTVIDTVSYKGLVPGRTYELTATLNDRDDEGTEVSLKDLDDAGLADLAKTVEGQDVTVLGNGHVSFVAASADGEVRVPMSLDASKLAGHTLVAFEALADNDKTVATHADINDEGQAVSVKGGFPATPSELLQTGRDNLPWILAGLGAILLAAAGVWYWRYRRGY